MDYSMCTEITPDCPVEATTYGYYPNLAGNATLLAVYAACMLVQMVLSIKGRTWTWGVGLVLGCGLEVAGYVGRILMRSNPWNQGGVRDQIITLILAPSFIAAGIDLTLKHLVIRFGARHSLIAPKLYTWLFISLDIFSIVLQAIGGGIAASGFNGPSASVALLDAGNSVIIAGIAIQVFQLVAFGVVSAHFAFTVRRRAPETYVPPRLRFFIAMVVLAYFAVLLRCVYRLPEMAAGWGKGLQRDEPTFLVLDGAAVAVAAIALTVAHPAVFFPVMGNGRSRRQEDAGAKAAEPAAEKAERSSDEADAAGD